MRAMGMAALTDLFTKPILSFSLADLGCAALLLLLIYALSFLLHGFYLGLTHRWREY